ncbi:hypothetical protein, partial [Paenibacillus odorifer]|uniref:hypothetical protein n=1 Tax=Paenibacillus odorifer TaxID=189426 RepID=UPI001C4D5645
LIKSYAVRNSGKMSELAEIAALRSVTTTAEVINDCPSPFIGFDLPRIYAFYRTSTTITNALHTFGPYSPYLLNFTVFATLSDSVAAIYSKTLLSSTFSAH